jgi:hypothetical protein
MTALFLVLNSRSKLSLRSGPTVTSHGVRASSPSASPYRAESMRHADLCVDPAAPTKGGADPGVDQPAGAGNEHAEGSHVLRRRPHVATDRSIVCEDSSVSPIQSRSVVLSRST